MTYLCEICNKKYITNSGFWKHNNKYHNNIQKNNLLNITQKSSLFTQKSSLFTQKSSLFTQNSSLNKLECIYCNKILSRIDNLKRHEDKCKNKKNEIDKLRTQVTILEPLVQKYEIELLNNNNQITTTNNNQITTNNNSNNNNNTVNNNTINIIKFGGENLSEILTEAEMMKIIKYINLSVNESIKMVHFNNKRPQYKNIKIKNLKDNHLEIHNGKKFITDKKYNNLYELIDNHIYNIQTFITNNKEKFHDLHLVKIEKFLRLIEEDAKCVINKVKYDSYYDFKVDDINTLIYNLCKNE